MILELCALKTTFDVDIYQRQQNCFVSSLVTELAYPLNKLFKTNDVQRPMSSKSKWVDDMLNNLFK